MDFHSLPPSTKVVLSSKSDAGRVLRHACPSDDQRGTCSRSMLVAQPSLDAWTSELQDAYRDPDTLFH